MPSHTLSREELRDLLIKNWMTHDGLWYSEVAKKLGMAEASPMNLRVCRKLGQIEFSRLIKMVEASPPKDMTQYRELFELGQQAFFPDFMHVQIAYPSHNTQVFHVFDCFAHRSMEKAGLLPDYECGIIERIEGWFDAMGLKYARTPDLSHCLKFIGNECKVTVQFHFS